MKSVYRLLLEVEEVVAERLLDAAPSVAADLLEDAEAAERCVDSTVVLVVEVERTLPSLFTFDVVLVVLLG